MNLKPNVAIANRTTSLNQSEVTHESRIGSGRPWDDAPLHLRYQMEHRPHAQWLGLTSSVAERLSGTLLDRRCLQTLAMRALHFQLSELRTSVKVAGLRHNSSFVPSGETNVTAWNSPGQPPMHLRSLRTARLGHNQRIQMRRRWRACITASSRLCVLNFWLMW